MLRLIDAEEKYLDGYREAYLLSVEKLKEGKIKKHNLMFKNLDEVNIIQNFKDNRDQSKLPSNSVPSYDFFAVDGDKFIGVIHIRTKLTERLLTYGGHIGYAVNPKYWNMGYGKQMLKLGLEKYSDIIQDNKILITCDDDNIGSYKIIEFNGGQLENKVENEVKGERFLTRRYWINK